MKEKLLKIVNHYGMNNQQRKLAEEVFELQEAITSHITEENLQRMHGFPISTENIAEEIADVMVLLNQFAFYYDIKLEDINNMMSYKVNRQLERIKNGE